MRIRNRIPGPRVWTTIVALLVVLTFLLPPFYGCGTKGEFLVEQLVKAAEGATISSGDRGITLEIPPDALSEDTRVTLSVVPEEEWADDIRVIEPLGSVYRLEPDGIELEKPATLTIRLDPDDLAGLELPEGAFPACVVLTRRQDGEWDMLHNPVTKVDLDTGEVLVTGEATHFCDSCVEYALFDLSILPMKVSKYKKEKWQADLTIYVKVKSDIEINFEVSYFGDGEVACTQNCWRPSFNLAPGGSDVIKPKPQFCCVREGRGRFVARVFAEYRIKPHDPKSGEPFYSDEYWLVSMLNAQATAPNSDEEGKIRSEPGGVTIDVSGTATCVKPLATPAPVSEGAPEEPEEQEKQVACGLTFDPSPCEFGDVCVGKNEIIYVWVTNSCDFDIVPDYKWPKGAFEVCTSIPSGALGKGQSYRYGIKFRPLNEDVYFDTFMITSASEHGDTGEGNTWGTNLSGNGVVCEQQASAISIDGSWNCTLTATGSQLDLLDLQISSKANGQDTMATTIVKVITIVNGVERFNSGDINATVFPPPSDQPYIFRHPMTCSGPYTATIKVFTADGETHEKSWEVYCDEEPAEQPPEVVEGEIAYKLTYEHTMPGVQSEAYLDITGPAGANVDITLSGPGVVSSAHMTGTLDDDGKLRLTWVINQFGTYSVSGTVDGTPVSATVGVQ